MVSSGSSSGWASAAACSAKAFAAGGRGVVLELGLQGAAEPGSRRGEAAHRRRVSASPDRIRAPDARTPPEESVRRRVVPPWGTGGTRGARCARGVGERTHLLDGCVVQPTLDREAERHSLSPSSQVLVIAVWRPALRRFGGPGVGRLVGVGWSRSSPGSPSAESSTAIQRVPANCARITIITVVSGVDRKAPGRPQIDAPEGQRQQQHDRVDVEAAALHPRLDHVADEHADRLQHARTARSPARACRTARGRRSAARPPPMMPPITGM